MALGKRSELTGGGLIRSMGGWSAVRAMQKTGITEKSDDRILGSGTFVAEVMNQAEKKISIINAGYGQTYC
jgi:putative transposase